MVVDMKSFTIRGIDDKLYDEIKKHSADKSTSINKFILMLLKVNTGFEKEKEFTKSYNDLDELFGKWSIEEYDLITKKINSERVVDEELWK
jgi:hypothetical protein